MSKYSIPDGHWDDTDENDDEDEDDAPRASVDTQTVDIVYERGPEPNYKYAVRISHGDHDMEPFAVSATRYKRKAQQYWREDQQEDWVDLPEAVRRRVASVVADVDSRSELDPGYRIINPDHDDEEDLRADGGTELGVQCDVDDCDERVVGLDDGWEMPRGTVCQSCIDHQDRHGHWPDEDVDICVECRIDDGLVPHECEESGADRILLEPGSSCSNCGYEAPVTDGGQPADGNADGQRVRVKNREWIEKQLAAVPIVEWDRFVPMERNDTHLVDVYGWIDRDDEYKDFVWVRFLPEREWFEYTTSSDEYTDYLAGEWFEDSGADDGHTSCRRVEHTFNIENVVTLTEDTSLSEFGGETA